MASYQRNLDRVLFIFRYTLAAFEDCDFLDEVFSLEFFYTDARAHAVNMRLVSTKTFVGWPASPTQQTSTLHTELLNRWRLVMCSRIVRYAPCTQTSGLYWHSVVEKFIEWAMKLVSKILVYCVTTAFQAARCFVVKKADSYNSFLVVSPCCMQLAAVESVDI